MVPISKGTAYGFEVGEIIAPLGDLIWHWENFPIGVDCSFLCVQIQKDVGALGVPDGEKCDGPKIPFPCDA